MKSILTAKSILSAAALATAAFAFAPTAEAGHRSCGGGFGGPVYGGFPVYGGPAYGPGYGYGYGRPVYGHPGFGYGHHPYARGFDRNPYRNVGFRGDRGFRNDGLSIWGRNGGFSVRF